MAISCVTVKQQMRSQEVRNVLYYQHADNLTDTQRQDAADAIRAAWAAFDTSVGLVNDWNLYAVNFRRVDVADLPGIDVVPTAGVLTGSTSASPGLANPTALLISFAAPTTSPRRARTYLAGMSTAQLQDSGFWPAAVVTAAGTLATALDSITVTGDTMLRVAVRFTGSPPAVTVSNRLQTFIVRSNPATQRRRRIGIGA